MPITNPTEASHADNSTETGGNTEDKKDTVLNYHKCHKKNHFSRDYVTPPNQNERHVWAQME